MRRMPPVSRHGGPPSEPLDGGLPRGVRLDEATRPAQLPSR